MSTVKSPLEKKRLSLELDRRNSYRENAKASRKNIPRSKARSHRDERRSVAQALFGAVAAPTEALDVVDAQARSTARKKKVNAFKKSPDQPLQTIIVKKEVPRKRRAKHA